MTPALANVLRQIAAHPGELSDRPIRYGRIIVCSLPRGNIPPDPRWVERARTKGLIAPARVRRMRHALEPRVGHTTGERWVHETGLPLDIMRRLVAAGDEGLTVSEVAGAADASGNIERALIHLYRAGLASPPAGLWVPT